VRANLAAVALAVTLSLAAWPGGGDATDLVGTGARWWNTSPDPTNPVACATCHFDPAAVRGWAASFPKLRPLPPPHARVMTLFQATAEAVALHYRVADPRPAAAALTAYLTALGAGLPLTPGISASQPVFPARLAALAASVERGGRRFVRSCQGCHPADAVARRLPAFPRQRDGQAESLEGFLENHGAAGGSPAWDSPSTADVVAYLTARLAEGEHP
jgi:mono/diheme cytochrome c family protein